MGRYYNYQSFKNVQVVSNFTKLVSYYNFGAAFWKNNIFNISILFVSININLTKI